MKPPTRLTRTSSTRYNIIRKARRNTDLFFVGGKVCYKMGNIVKKIPGAQFFYRALRAHYRAASEKKLISTYLANNTVNRLHIGCGGNILTDWLNSDYYPAQPNVIHLDATKHFPFEANTFDYVFSEHMIEHIKYTDGLHMLKECNRILKTNAIIRISTPNLKFVVDLYSNQKTELQERYIKWASDNFIKNGYYCDTMVINNFVRDWGHLFIYDDKTLRHSLELSGFVDIKPCNLNVSDDPNLKDLENDARMPAGFLQLESFTLEARKP
jgi:predicted SAM-dependent methyltransferase